MKDEKLRLLEMNIHDYPDETLNELKEVPVKESPEEKLARFDEIDVWMKVMLGDQMENESDVDFQNRIRKGTFHFTKLNLNLWDGDTQVYAPGRKTIELFYLQLHKYANLFPESSQMELDSMLSDLQHISGATRWKLWGQQCEQQDFLMAAREAYLVALMYKRGGDLNGINDYLKSRAQDMFSSDPVGSPDSN